MDRTQIDPTSKAESPYTLGVCGLGTGFAVGLFENESLLFAIEEDKLRRSKGAGIRQANSWESRAVGAAMAFAGAAPESIGRVVYTPPVDASAEEIRAEVSFLSDFLDRCHSITAPVTAIEHVRAQMAFASAVEPDADAVLMVGRTRIAEGKVADGELRIGSVSEFDLVGKVERLAEYLGLHPGRIHHLENMARLGEARFQEAVADAIAEPNASPVDVLERVLGRPRLGRGASPGPADFDVAASIQAVLVSRVLDRVASIIDPEADHAVALCGGVFHSWSLNDELHAAFSRTRFSVSFAPGNAGCAIGGFMAECPGAMASRPGPFLGPRYSRDDVKQVLDNCKARYAFHTSAEVLDLVCDALGEGKMVGWFGDRCEFGLRALGARSVLTNPANPYACDNLSSYLKKRPAYMSYAVVMSEETAPVRSPFMSRSTVLPGYFGEGRVRVQTVTRASAPVLDQLLSICRQRLSVPALLNTSLNYFDEPIACAPRDAVKTFYASGLDMLVMENFVLRKS